jgi:hypothetical protein
VSVRAIVVTACLVTLLPGAAAAQSIGGGVKGGASFGDVPNIADGVDAASDILERRIGYAVGGFVAIRFGNGFSIQPEALYTQKGVGASASGLIDSAEFKLKADYVDVPILGRFTFGKGLRGYVFAGPSLNFLISAKAKSGFLEGGSETDVSEDMESFEAALVLGGGIEIGPLLVEARWSEGLTNILVEGVSPAGTDLKTRTLLVLAGLRF